MTAPPPLILASASPRRRDLLTQIGFAPRVLPAHIPEERNPHELPPDYALRLAREKARHTASLLPPTVSPEDRYVIAADTIVVLHDRVLEKPRDPQHALDMLRDLSGHTHTVFTAVAALDRHTNRLLTSLVATHVTFCELDALTLTRYVASGEPLDKAGAYGIQGRGAALVRSIHGSYSAVVGLPLAETLDLLKALDAIDAPPLDANPIP